MITRQNLLLLFIIALSFFMAGWCIGSGQAPHPATPVEQRLDAITEKLDKLNSRSRVFHIEHYDLLEVRGFHLFQIIEPVVNGPPVDTGHGTLRITSPDGQLPTKRTP